MCSLCHEAGDQAPLAVQAIRLCPPARQPRRLHRDLNADRSSGLDCRLLCEAGIASVGEFLIRHEKQRKDYQAPRTARISMRFLLSGSTALALALFKAQPLRPHPLDLLIERIHFLVALF